MIRLKNNEVLLYSTEVDNLIENKEKISNIYLRVLLSLLGVVGSEDPIKFNLILTNQNLYLEAIGISSWGRLPETRYIEEISFKDITEFSVSLNEHYEFISIKAKKNINLHLRRDNKNLDNIGENISNKLSYYIN